jgi:hypothetical protein
MSCLHRGYKIEITMKEIEDTEDVDEMEQTLDHLRRDRVDDLAGTASLLGSWMSDQK